MKKVVYLIFCIHLLSCDEQPREKIENSAMVKLVTLDPGHFHAALVQKTMYPGVDTLVHVYAPEGKDLDLHLSRINSYNSRAEKPSHWKEQTYTGDDFFNKMIEEKKGNVVILSGNNKRKTEYIFGSLQNGFHVLADKPMAIDGRGFELLEQSFKIAEKNQLLLYDIMTERYEITTILQKELSAIPEVFGELEKGTPESPAITKESVHHLYKHVSGIVLTRPAWFLDASQQGEGIVDVMTHLVDLVQWECFPDQRIDYPNDIAINSARRWTTDIGISQFKEITKLDTFPGYLDKQVSNDSLLKISCNAEINYTIRGVHAKTSVTWNYKAPDGTGDTHHSVMRGTKANLLIRQGPEENYQPTLFIELLNGEDQKGIILEKFKLLAGRYPGISLNETKKGWQVIIPDTYKEGHEAHFARVMEKFLEYLKNKNMPAWEVPNMLAKYYTTSKGLEIALKNHL
jgi:predicted dehydrogenase